MCDTAGMTVEKKRKKDRDLSNVHVLEQRGRRAIDILENCSMWNQEQNVFKGCENTDYLSKNKTTWSFKNPQYLLRYILYGLTLFLKKEKNL